jgi:hypothetical protein
MSAAAPRITLTIQLTNICAEKDALRQRRQAALAADACRYSAMAEMDYAAGITARLRPLTPHRRQAPTSGQLCCASCVAYAGLHVAKPAPTIRLAPPSAPPAINKPSLAL